jgi:hypothetical protein
MKLTLFIGHHKTGSTSLQTYLADNYEHLLSKGILYPAVEAKGVAANLASLLRGQDHKGPMDINIREPHNALAFALLNEATDFVIPDWHKNLPSAFQMLQLIEEQINAIHPDHTILCSEVMTLFSEKGWAKTMPRIRARFGRYDTTIVLNLRRIDEYLASWHLQRLKFGSTHDPLRLGAQRFYHRTAHFRYDQIVYRWSDALPKARLVVRNYSDVVRSGGTIADFFQQSQINYELEDSTLNLNASIPYAMAEIVRKANAQISQHRQEMISYIMSAIERIRYASNQEVELYGQKQRDWLTKAFAPVHRNLSAHLGVTNFFPDMDDAAKCRAIPELDAANDALAALRKDMHDFDLSQPIKDFLTTLSLNASA